MPVRPSAPCAKRSLQAGGPKGPPRQPAALWEDGSSRASVHSDREEGVTGRPSNPAAPSAESRPSPLWETSSGKAGRGERGGEGRRGGSSAPAHPRRRAGGILRRRPLALSGGGRSSVPVTAACARYWRRFPPHGRREEGRETRFPPYPGRAPSRNRRRRHFTLPAPAAGPPPSSSPLASPPLGPGWEGGAKAKGGGTRPPSPPLPGRKLPS